ncbi:MAG: 50S ribosome-binding GTPase [Planctomycetes bacterium]|nr:50S ribosome-binding GTPase [Planctomycetota bacterium]
MRLLTPPGIAGVAVVQFGAAERPRLAPCLRSTRGEAIATVPGAPPRRALLQLDGLVVDDVLVVDRGAVGLELHLHGSAAVLAALARAFVFDDAPVLPPAVRLLRDAMCESQLELAIEQLGLDFERFCRDVADLPPAARSTELAAVRERSRVALAQVVPARLVLLGAQNAGKSSLFNRLLFRERVLTGPAPGLTRDPVAEVTALDGYPYEVVDTAGEGPAASAVDGAAIERGRRLRSHALQVLVVDGHRGPSVADRELAGGAVLVVANKADLPQVGWPADMPCHLRVSCAAEQAVLLRARIGAALRQCRALPAAGRVGGIAALSAEDLARLA